MIIELVRRGEIPGMILLASMPEQPHIQPLIPLIRDWMGAHDAPNEVFEYKVTNIKRTIKVKRPTRSIFDEWRFAVDQFRISSVFLGSKQSQPLFWLR